MAKEHKNIVHAWTEEVWNKPTLNAVDRLLKPRAIFHGLRDERGKVVVGRVAYKKHYGQFRTIFPDLRMEVLDSITQGNKTAARCLATATHLGAGFGLPPTGKKIAVPGMIIAYEENGMLVESWNSFDYMELCRQLGQGIS